MPSRVTINDSKPDFEWENSTNELILQVPRGAAPDYIRRMDIELPYAPHVLKHMKAEKPAPDELEFKVWNAARLPAGANSFLRTYPPLIMLDPERATFIVLGTSNRNLDSSRDVDVSVEGTFHGSDSMRVAPQKDDLDRVRLKPSGKEAMALAPGPDGLIRGTINLKAGHDLRTMPVAFLPPDAKGTNHYRFDFDRDGADEWVLENSQLRLIVSPESGGRAIALMDKSNGENLSTSVGLLRDNFSYTESPAGVSEDRAYGRYGMFNRPYTAAWDLDSANSKLRLAYYAPDVFPAGAKIEKTVQLENSNTLRVDYLVSLPASGPSQTAKDSPASQPQSFVAVNSFPALASSERVTRFCWSNMAAANSSGSPPSASAETANLHCEDFVALGKDVEVPKGADRVEIHSPGQRSIAIKWECSETCASMTITPKRFSALFQLKFPPLGPGTAASSYTIRIQEMELP
jgi:hypothetical protein